MHNAFNQAVAEAMALAAEGRAWHSLARLQGADIEDVLLRLLDADLRSLPPSVREEAVTHAVSALYEQWAMGNRVVSVLGFLKTAARRRASNLRRDLPPTEPFDAQRHDLEAEQAADDDPVKRRRAAVEIARGFLPTLGMPSLIDTFSFWLDLVEAGEDASPTAIAEQLDVPYSTVTTHLSPRAAPATPGERHLKR